MEFVIDHATVVDTDGNTIDLTLPDRSTDPETDEADEAETPAEEQPA
jgi:hypothetical protein